MTNPSLSQHNPTLTLPIPTLEAAKEEMPPWQSSTFSLVEDTKIKSRAVMHCFEPKMEWKAGMKTSFPLTQQTQKAHLFKLVKANEFLMFHTLKTLVGKKSFLDEKPVLGRAYGILDSLIDNKQISQAFMIFF
ncbi:hypothetical protein Tco_1522840 [Tanacetum coccineum]